MIRVYMYGHLVVERRRAKSLRYTALFFNMLTGSGYLFYPDSITVLRSESQWIGINSSA